MVFSSSVFAANEKVSAWDSFLGLFGVKATETSDVGVEYRGHVENKGDFPLDGTWIQGPDRLGTVGEGLRLEAFWIKLADDAPEGLNIEYQVHVQNKGWMGFVNDGAMAGTEGEGLRIEAIEIALVDDEGEVAEGYSVEYRGHVQNIGDTAWYADGDQLGTTGSGLRLEALEIKIVQTEADLTAYEAALAAVKQADYTAASWTTYKAVVDANVVTVDNTQTEVDEATAAITAAQANLVKVLKVESVSAINLNQVKVTFAGEVDKTSAETITNYVLAGVDLTASDKAELQSDKKTVLINLNTAQVQFAKAAFKVKGNMIFGGSSTQTVPTYETTLTFSDTVVPTVSSITVTGNKQLTVVFSEPVFMNPGFVTAAGSKFKIDGQYLTNYGFSSATAQNLTASNYSNKLVLDFATAINAGTYSLTTLASDGTNLKDAAGFALVEQANSFTIASVVNAPTIVSVTGQDNGTIYVTYDRAMATSALTAANYKVNDVTLSTVGTFKSGTGDTVVKLASIANVSAGANTLTVVKNTVADSYGNLLNATADTRVAFTATTDTTKPTVTSVSSITNSQVRVKFSEDVNSAYATNKANYVVKDSSGLTISNTNYAIATTTSADTYDINFTTPLVGSNYSLTIKNVVDLAKVPNVMDPYTTSFSGIDDVAPTVLSRIEVAGSTTKVAVNFSEAMDASTITNAANYQYQDNATPAVTRNLPSGTTLVAGADNKSVEITFPTSYVVNGTATTQYSVILLNTSNVKDAGGNVLQNISTGLLSITAPNTATGPAYVAESFKLTATSSKVTAEFSMDQAITTLVRTDFTVAGQQADAAYMSGKKVVLEFTNAGKMAAIKAAGVGATLATATETSTNVYGTPIVAIPGQVVYEDLIAPELLSIAKVNGSTTQINVVFSESLDDTILGLYANDFTVQSGGTLNTISSVTATQTTVPNDTLVLNLGTPLTSGTTVVKAASVVDIKDLKDAAETQNLYVPTTSDKDGTNGTLAITQAAAPTYTINYTAEETTQTVPATVEYDDNAAFSTPTDGTGAAVALTPGTDMYFRVKQTATTVPGATQTLVVAARPAAPAALTINNATETSSVVATTQEYQIDAGDWTTGTGAGVALTPAQAISVRTTATASAFASVASATVAAPARAATPVLTGTTDGSFTITGGVATTDYEVSTDGTTWTTVTSDGAGVITVAGANTYSVRVKATLSNYASAPLAGIVVS